MTDWQNCSAESLELPEDSSVQLAKCGESSWTTLAWQMEMSWSEAPRQWALSFVGYGIRRIWFVLSQKPMSRDGV